MGTDDLNTVNGEIWSTEKPPTKLSSNKLTLSSRPGSEVDRVVSYLFSETPFDLSASTVALRAARGGDHNSGAQPWGCGFCARTPGRGSSFASDRRILLQGIHRGQVQIDDALFGPVSGVTMTIATRR